MRRSSPQFTNNIQQHFCVSNKTILLRFFAQQRCHWTTCCCIIIMMILSVCAQHAKTLTLAFSQCKRGNRRLYRMSPLRMAVDHHHCEDSSATNSLAPSLENEIFALTRGPFNINSPKQVSKAIFGTVQSARRDVLEKVANGKITNGIDEKGRQLATLILRYRDLQRINSLQPTPRQRQFSTLSNTQEEEEEEEASIEKFAIIDTKDVSLSTKPQTSQKSTQSSPYERKVESLFLSTSKIDDYWKDFLLQISRPSARSLVSQLDPVACPMGFDPTAVPVDAMGGAIAPSSSSTPTTDGTTKNTVAGKKGSFLAYCREQKNLYPDCITLVRCGDFYETFGVDAIMLVEHCGLNPMANKAKAGCPIRNVQSTIDGLTQQGFRVAVYEEAPDTDSLPGSGASAGSKSRIKSRFLAQIVSSASPTYLYDLLLLSNIDALATVLPSRPYVGVLSSAAGYTLVEVSVEERSVRISERLTAEAVACRLAAYPPADPLFYVPSPGEYEASSSGGTLSLPFLPSRKDASSSGPGSRVRTRIINPNLVPQPTANVNEIDRAKSIIVSAILEMNENQGDESSQTRQGAAADDFTVLASTPMGVNTSTNTFPLHVETAAQLGLMNDNTIPSLIAHILSDSAPSGAKRFMRRLLLTPPPPQVGQAMSQLVSFLKEDGPALPPLSVPPVGKVLSLLRAGQASAQVYGELMHALTSTIMLVDTLSKSQPIVLEALMTLLEYESGLAADPTSLRERCCAALEAMEAVISPYHHSRDGRFNDKEIDAINDYGHLIPGAFFARNEVSWRGRVRPSACPRSYELVRMAAEKLAEAVAADFYTETPTAAHNLVVQDVFNNLFAIKDIPEGKKKEDYIQARDRFGKLLRNRYTTERVQDAISSYVQASERARCDVAASLASLSQRLYDQGHIPGVVQAAHTNLIVSAAFHHAAKANVLGWNLAETTEWGIQKTSDAALDLKGVWPYWMDRAESVANTIDMNGMWLLTAPNMSGKSTLMRSTAAAALLSVCGLCAPLEPGSTVQRFDYLFVRGASADVPTEQKSAFGAEMEDVAAMLRCCGEKSLVFVDELGRGTSPRDGTRLAGAVLEAMAVRNMSGVFATHLHDILDLPLRARDRIATKRMAIHEHDERGHESDNYSWTYRLEDGVCKDSMALVTAAKFGVPAEVLRRAENLGKYIPEKTLSSPSSYTSVENRNVVANNGLLNGPSRKDAALTLFNLDKIALYVEETTGTQALPIPARWTTPASLEGKSCVYVLELDKEPPRFYVGETDNLRHRIKQHRSKKGQGWSDLSAIALPAEGKTEARKLESILIRSLARAGVPLVSTWDGQSI